MWSELQIVYILCYLLFSDIIFLFHHFFQASWCGLKVTTSRPCLSKVRKRKTNCVPSIFHSVELSTLFGCWHRCSYTSTVFLFSSYSSNFCFVHLTIHLSSGLSKETELVDGERLTLHMRDLGACEVYPQQVSHNSNGSFIVVCGDGEYIIYTSQALRNKAFGSALDFVWSSQGTGDYAIRESTSRYVCALFFVCNCFCCRDGWKIRWSSLKRIDFVFIFLYWHNMICLFLFLFLNRVRTFKNFKEHKQISLPIASADGTCVCLLICCFLHILSQVLTCVHLTALVQCSPNLLTLTCIYLVLPHSF